MSEWWSYRPADFLMFAPRTYWRLFELHNQAWWPMQPVLVVAGAAWLVWWMRGGASAARVGTAALALVFAFVGWAFLLERFAPINWAASAFAAGFFVAAAASAALAWHVAPQAAPPGRREVAWLLCGAALLAYPLLAVVAGRPLLQAEVFGLAPDPTALAALGLLAGVRTDAAADRAVLAALRALLLVWCAISAATLWTMGSAQGWVVAAGALVAVGTMWWPSRGQAA